MRASRSRCVHGAEFCTESLAQNASQEDDLDNAYELLELEDDAGEKEIKAQPPESESRNPSKVCHGNDFLDPWDRFFW